MTINERTGKRDIDAEAEREGRALLKQGQNNNQQYGRKRRSTNYNTGRFDTLFKD